MCIRDSFCLCLCDDILHLLDFVGGADALGDTLVVHGLHSGLKGLQPVSYTHLPLIGSMKLQDLTTRVIEGYYQRLLKYEEIGRESCRERV